KKDPFLIDSAYFMNQPINVEEMNIASQLLIRKTDFSCFSKSHTDTFTNDCDVRYAKWEVKNNLLIFTISADRFLRNMVRAIVGTLLEIGTSKLVALDIEKIIHSKDRGMAGKSVPAHGLYLTKIKYPEN